ncbi:MAG: poly-gamma-glutamate hydrolase family protein [Deltaproteobacteria bacterium]|nr:poly-gamma-glutamate hydrolase family protein [Deltaproteobacteria bacterium]
MGYRSFKELKQHEKAGKDYHVRFRQGHTGFAIMAIHGGCIEPGTTEIADAIAGQEHTFYTFSGLKERDGAALHITSPNFDEPLGLKIAKSAGTVITIHGCKGGDAVLYIGGRDPALKEKIQKVMAGSGFIIKQNPRFPGANSHNICNRCQSGRGIQLEISAGLRRRMFADLSRKDRKTESQCFVRFVSLLRQILSGPSGLVQDHSLAEDG